MCGVGGGGGRNKAMGGQRPARWLAASGSTWTTTCWAINEGEAGGYIIFITD